MTSCYPPPVNVVFLLVSCFGCKGEVLVRAPVVSSSPVLCLNIIVVLAVL